MSFFDVGNMCLLLARARKGAWFFRRGVSETLCRLGVGRDGR